MLERERESEEEGSLIRPSIYGLKTHALENQSCFGRPTLPAVLIPSTVTRIIATVAPKEAQNAAL